MASLLLNAPQLIASFICLPCGVMKVVYTWVYWGIFFFFCLELLHCPAVVGVNSLDWKEETHFIRI